MSDDELRARLRAADPAADLGPADPGLVGRLVADVTSTELTDENRRTGTRGRSSLTWLVAAAAAVVIAGVSVFALVGNDEEPPIPPTVADPVGDATVTELSAPGSAASDAKCAVPNAEMLARSTLAVDATVTDVTDAVVTLTVDHWYTGEPTALVRVEAPSDELSSLVGGTDFADGGRYLVAASDGQVMVCGFSGPYTEPLAAIYDEAFAG